MIAGRTTGLAAVLDSAAHRLSTAFHGARRHCGGSGEDRAHDVSFRLPVTISWPPWRRLSTMSRPTSRTLAIGSSPTNRNRIRKPSACN